MLDLLINTNQLSETNACILNAIYLSKMSKYYRPLAINDYEKKILNICQSANDNNYNQMNKFDVHFNESNFHPPIERLLQNSVDMMVPLAEKLFYNFEYNQCKKFLNFLLSRDIYHPDCLVIHIGCLVELNEKNSKYILLISLIRFRHKHALLILKMHSRFISVGS